MRFFHGLSLGAKVAASFAVVGVAAAVAGLGTFATFTSSTSASNTVTTGTVVIALGATGAQTNRLDINAVDVASDDNIQRTVDLLNTGSIALSTLTLTTTAAPSSLLDTDGTNGLQLTIDTCDVPWTEAGPPYTYTCSGSTSSVLATRAVIGATLTLNNLTAFGAAPTTDHLRIQLHLPVGAGNTFQGLTSTVSFNFTATQRAGTDK